MLAEIFGFDKYTEITSEQAIRGTYCDLAVKVDGKIKYLIEVKAIGLNLKENHLRQAIGYGANHGITWIVLTNGIEWQIHKIKFERPIGCDLVCTLDFSTINPRKQESQDKIFLLCKEGLAKAAIEEFHDHVQSVNRFIIGAITLSKPVLSSIRRELRKISPGIKVKEDEIKIILSSEVLKREVVEGESAEKALNRVKRILKKKARKKTTKTESVIAQEKLTTHEQ
jgi:predicted type IV restriction endonuclease